MKKLPFKIVIAFTPNYVVQAATTLYSIISNLSSQYEIDVICLLSESLSGDMKQLIESIDTRINLEYIDLRGRIKDMYVNQIYSEAALYRLLLPEIINNDVVLYLDCDIIVRTDLSKLNIPRNFSDYYFAAVAEVHENFMRGYVIDTLAHDGDYFNSGFLLMNIKKMREDGLSDKLLAFADNQKLMFPDQDALNVVCKGKIYPLPPKYNAIRVFRVKAYEEMLLQRYDANELSELKSEGNIHYVGGKPWNMYTLHFWIWWDYYTRLSKSIRSTFSPKWRMQILYRIFSIKSIRKFIIKD